MKRNESGVTLIALTVTIIILLILAGVSVSQLAGTDGLFNRSRQIVSDYSQTQADESQGVSSLQTELASLKTVVRDTAASRAIIFTASPDVINSNEYTDDDVVVNVSTTELYSDTSTYEIQLSTNGSTYTAKTSQTFTQNGKLYARIVQKSDSKILGTAILTVNRIDKTAPTNNLPTASSTAHTITVYNKITDAESKLTVNYRIRQADGTWGSWQPNAIFYNLEINTTYDVQTKATDQAGHTVSNASLSGTNYTRISTLTRDEEQTGSINVIVNGGGGGGGGSAGYGVLTIDGLIYSVTPSTPTTGMVTVKCSSYAPQYIVQTSMNGTTWTNANEVTFIQNGHVYARLKDPETGNTTSSTTITVSNITSDIDAPSLTYANFSPGFSTLSATLNLVDPSGVDFVNSSWEITKYATKLGTDPMSYSHRITENPYEISYGLLEDTYYLHVLAYDTIGNKKEYVSSAFTIVDSKDFIYTGSQQVISLAPGKYRLMCWGASGATRTNAGGRGGYSEGVITLKDTTNLYLYVGGQGTITNGNKIGGFNGGGNANNDGSSTSGAPGGGGTDIRINSNSLYARVIVAGGGGGGNTYTTCIGGYGGGEVGQVGTWTNGGHGRGLGANQILGGGTEGAYGGTSGAFGIGANATMPLNSPSHGGSGGGGGWYGGGSTNGLGGGGGGSGYVYTQDTAHYYPDGCLLNSDFYLSATKMYNGSQTFLSTTGSAEQGHIGNGYIRIECIENTYTDTSNPNIENFYWTGDYQSVYLEPGRYMLECWGAQGGDCFDAYGNLINRGGKGAYSVGQINIVERTAVYVYVGGGGSRTNYNHTGGFNGGGNSNSDGSATFGLPGGGASDIRIKSKSLYARVIVAGGGGGANSYSSCIGGYAGGSSGQVGTWVNSNHGRGLGATQTNGGGTQGAYGGTSGAFGIGANATIPLNSTSHGGSGGGGGWYGGGSTNGLGGGGGGSGYIYTANTLSDYPNGCLGPQYYLSGASMKTGNETFTHPNGLTEQGHSGNGFVRITKIA